MASVPADLTLHPHGGEPLTIADQVKLFHLVAVALDPYTYESSWILETAGRILDEFYEADCRTAWIIAADERDATAFLGPWQKRMLTFCDPERKAITAFGLEELPALLHVGPDLSIIGKAEGWNPDEWREVTDNLAELMSWSRPVFPLPSDPVAYEGSPASG